MNGRQNNKNKNKEYPAWHDFVAGSAAGAGARILTHPLDLIRIRRQLAATLSDNSTKQQSQKSMWEDLVQVVRHEGGFRGLFRGNLAAINLWVSYTGVQFYAFGVTKRYFQTIWPDQPTAVAFCAGSSAGVAATLSTYPLDLCRTIFAARGATVSEVQESIAAVGEAPKSSSTATAESSASTTTKNTAKLPKASQPKPPQQHPFRPPKSTMEFATNLFKGRGWKGFFAGVTPTVVQIIPYMGSSFAIYDYLTRGDRNVSLSAYAGSIAGAVSKTLVYPMDTVKKRMQAQAFFGTTGEGSRPQYTGIMDCVTSVYKVEGWRGFYNGLVPSVLKTALAAGLSFAFFRTTKNLLESIHEEPFTEHNPPTRHALTRRMTGNY